MKIVTRERETTRELAESILAFAPLLLLLHHKIAELDCIISFAMVSQLNNYSRPKMVEERVLYLNQSRHPLLEVALQTMRRSDVSSTTTFIPNDLELAADREGCVKILSGPNSSGKSVFLKQCALIVIMGQIGCFVPARSALIGVTDYIGGRMGTPESLSDAKSSFISDLNRVGQAIRRAGPRSLLLLDEFGSGTSDADGAAVFAASLLHFLRAPENCPKILAATHFTSVCGPTYLPINVNLEFLSMSVALEEQLDGDETVTYLYKVTKGPSVGAYAMNCAKNAGMNLGR
jgi:DNA mismatch repair protein MSH5